MAINTGATLGMVGNYDSNSSGQLALVNSTIPYIRLGIEVLDTSFASSPLTIADYGSAHGRNSMYVMKVVIQHLKEFKKIQEDDQILVIHNDLPTNDWTHLFELLNNDSLYHGVASGRSFYEQCLPPNSLSVGFSSASLHWLSCKPCNISNHCFSTFAQGKEREAFKHQSKLDLASFLKHRSRELVSGGILILNISCVNDQGLMGRDKFFSYLFKCAQSILTPQELLDYSIPAWFRSPSECIDLELFDQCSFKLIKAEPGEIKIPAYEQYRNGFMTLDQFIKAFAMMLRVWSESPLKQALQINGQSKEDIDKKLTQFWNMFEEEIRERSHELVDVCSYSIYLILKKV